MKLHWIDVTILVVYLLGIAVIGFLLCRTRTGCEWFWRVDRHRKPDPIEPKVSMWKCPYHNGRACLEIVRRAALIQPTQATEEPS